MKFLDRGNELGRLQRCFSSADNYLAVIYGRRRCGKSTLLQEVADDRTIYYLADQSEVSLQLASLATEVSRRVADFSAVIYPDWTALLKNLHNRLDAPVNLMLDEFPYLVAQSPELPSVIQKYLDLPGTKQINFVLCGSSQRMMHGLFLNAKAPLYGRARETLKIEPLQPGWITAALGLKPAAAVEYYAVLGGVPRYWELALEFNELETAVKDLILDRQGVLHDEPLRLLLDDMDGAAQPYSILSLIGSGCSKLSEIAARLEKPATSMTRPLALLQELGYVRKEIPFGEDPRKSRRTLYRINDPFINFHFRFVRPNKSLLELELMERAWELIRPQLPLYYSQVWEDLARMATPYLDIDGIEWGPAQRWWGRGRDGKEMELDVVAESLNGKHLLVGEAKWSSRTRPDATVNKLKYSAANLPGTGGREIITAAWSRHGGYPETENILPEQVFSVLRR